MGNLRPYVKTTKQKQGADKSFLGRNREGKREVEKCCVTVNLWRILLNTLIPNTAVYQGLALLVTDGTARRNSGSPGFFSPSGSEKNRKRRKKKKNKRQEGIRGYSSQR